ncbi:MAG: hypothetical protein J6B75_04460 [Ruminococcus sp.]|nr:hypothetical protein [Ruminococcus sp.]
MGEKGCHEGHRDRIRKRFVQFGADSLHEHELLELALFYGIPRKNTNEIAHKLLDELGGINGILNATADELCKIKGIGPSAAAFIRFLSDACREYNSFIPSLQSPEAESDYPMYFRDCFNGTAAGLCLILCPGTSCRIVFSKDGILNGTTDMVQIANQLLKMECDRVIIGINRIEGHASPETDDIELAGIFKRQLSLLGIELADFLIIGRKRSFSLMYDGAFSF